MLINMAYKKYKAMKAAKEEKKQAAAAAASTDPAADRDAQTEQNPQTGGSYYSEQPKH